MWCNEELGYGGGIYVGGEQNGHRSGFLITVACMQQGSGARARERCRDGVRVKIRVESAAGAERFVRRA